MTSAALRAFLLVVLLPALSLAQSVPHLYVGASAFVPASWDGATLRNTRPVLTVGLQLSSRWAVELNPQLYWYHAHTSNSYVENGALYTYSGASSSWTLGLPLLARLTLTTPGKRWQVEALGGVSWLHGWGHSQYSSVSNGQTTYEYDNDYSSNYAALVLGPQVRHEFTAKFSGKLSLPINFGLTEQGSFSQRFYFTPQLGVQYAFAR